MPKRIDRRVFLSSGATIGAALVPGTSPLASPNGPPAPGAYREPARDVPIVELDDVIVCGAGPAGVAAAIAAARAGAKTRLLESCGCLGGVWTAGLLSWILDATNKPGLMEEMLAELGRRGASAKYGSSIGYDVELMKRMLDEMCIEAGVKIQLHTRVVAAVPNESNRLALAVTESKSGRQAWSADVFVDATGDGDLAAQAGCGFDYGRPGSRETQPLSMIVLLVGIEPEGMTPFVRGLAEARGERHPKDRLLQEMRRAGVDPSYAQPTLFYIREGLFAMMANHEYGIEATDAAAITEATLRARAEVHKLVDGLRSLGGAWKGVQIVATPEHIGVREGRRIHGLYEVTQEDLIAGREHDDAVCRVTFPVDVHSTDPGKDKGIMKEGVRAKPYDVPYRALIARDVDGLLMAGRCISGDFIAHSSYRVTGNAVAMGEAAGAAAAIASRTKRRPQEVPWREIQSAIQRADKTELRGA
ncbi:MAG TPA: FAD-dependent oxidoreductase [Thermoguttaceae bacterium]|nr:FAD-dependent oxidoreductase [Thermoguttaceae bacterium]